MFQRTVVFQGPVIHCSSLIWINLSQICFDIDFNIVFSPIFLSVHSPDSVSIQRLATDTQSIK